MKYFLVLGSILFLLICCFSLYIGNYLYDYTLNPYSKHTLLENLIPDQDSVQEAQQWMAENSQDVYIESDDHLKLHAYSIQQDSHVYVIMVHGYRGDGTTILSPIKQMKNQGYCLLVPDLRGHGKSEGNYIGMGWDDRLDILQWIDYIIGLDQNASIILYGVSMGGATVMNVSGEKLPAQVKAIIEDCGYTSVWDVLKTYIDMEDWQSDLALSMASLVTKMRAGYYLGDVQPLEQVKKSQTPILFIHGGCDDFVPVAMVDELYAAATCPKEKLIIEKAGHANSCSVDSELYYQTVFHFIRRYQ